MEEDGGRWRTGELGQVQARCFKQPACDRLSCLNTGMKAGLDDKSGARLFVDT